jgi:hypothetical protein
MKQSKITALKRVAFSSAIKLEEISSPETNVNFQQATQHYIPKDSL